MPSKLTRPAAALLLAAILAAGPAVPALAAEGLPGAQMSLWWGLPFAGLLLSIASGPLIYSHIWEHHYGKVAAFWAALVVVPMLFAFGLPATTGAILHAVLTEYLPFIVLLFALYTVAGGLLVTGNIHGTPAVNTGLLIFGTVLASFVGTTGASMILIRPLIRANDDRKVNAHVVIFFIFLVSNIGGSLTPLGDPPLFVGFLRGVDFFWTTTHLFRETLLVAGLLLVVFFVLDTVLHRRDKRPPRVPDPTPDTRRIGLLGLANLPLLAGIVAAILMSASWKPGIAFDLMGVTLELQNLLRDALILGMALLSLVLSKQEHRERNGFSWAPIREVAKLFAAIFICVVPVAAMLKAGTGGALAPLVALVTGPDGNPDNLFYFWATGLLSSVLDNAPTYLVFFELAGGDAQRLMYEIPLTLAAISAGAVFMGAVTYIGNAPNFMVYAIARSAGVRMPSFFGYMAWSVGILIPIFIAVGLIFFAA